MKILVIAHFQGDGSPTACYIHAQAKAYKELGNMVKVIVPIPYGKRDFNDNRFSKAVTESDIDGVAHCFVRYFSLSNYGALGVNASNAKLAIRLSWRKIFDGFVPDVIHAHTIGFDSEIASWVKMKIHCPAVVTVHGTDVTMLLQNGHAAYLKKCCNHVDKVVAVSTALKKKIESVNSSTTCLSILNGFEMPKSENIEKLPYRMLQVGNLIPSKRYHITIEAFTKIHNQIPQASLVIIGRGKEREKLETQCSNNGIKQSVQFLGQIDNAAVLEEMSKASYFVMASAPEGFGIVYLEAMASKCITIGTRGEGISDLIIDGENGFLVPVDNSDAIADVILKAIKNPLLYKNISQKGKSDVSHLTWRSNAEKYIEQFKELINIDSIGGE